jgi:CPA2 family monovalent cation:H+ antiporter-2
MVMAAASSDVAVAFIELGAILVGLTFLARVSDRFGMSPIPAYLIAGLVFGHGGLVAPALSEDFIELAAEIGVVLLLFTLGLEYTVTELVTGVRRGARTGALDLVLNAVPGVATALLLGWGVKGAVVLGGVTYISSSGVIAKVLNDFGRLGNRETPVVLTVLVIEDLVMAAFLPVLVVVLSDASPASGAISVVAALGVAGLLLLLVARFGERVTSLLDSRSDEALLLGVMGTTLLVAGVTQHLDVSAAVGAFLVGIAISGPVGIRTASLINPLRDLFAALFFILFGFQIDPAQLPGVLPVAIALIVVTTATKYYVGRYGAARAGIGRRGQVRAGTVLVAHGEFSIIIAGLAIGQGLHEDVVPLAAAYVLGTAILGPVLTRFADPLAELGQGRRREARDPSPSPDP